MTHQFSKKFPTPETAMIDALRRLTIFEESFVVIRERGVREAFFVVSEGEWEKRSFQRSKYEREYAVYPDGTRWQIN